MENILGKQIRAKLRSVRKYLQCNYISKGTNILRLNPTLVIGFSYKFSCSDFFPKHTKITVVEFRPEHLAHASFFAQKSNKSISTCEIFSKLTKNLSKN